MTNKIREIIKFTYRETLRQIQAFNWQLRNDASVDAKAVRAKIADRFRMCAVKRKALLTDCY